MISAISSRIQPISLPRLPLRWLRVAWLGLLLCCAFLPPTPLLAQDYDRYQPLQCMGPIPEELRIAASKKYEREVEALGDSARGKEGRARNNFLLQSNFVLDDMLLSGRVVFGDPVSAYITQVKDHILRDQPELQKVIRIYLVKSPVVNAFATNSGVLLVNMGLIAHLKTESELAFVLCHEIQHYIHKHPINNYVNSQNLKSNARLLGLNNAEDYIAARTRYSRTLELDADASGFDLYSKSGYSLAAAEGVFELLDYADQAYDQVPWDASAFEWEYLRFPAQFTKWPLDSINIKEDDDDTLSTHPNIARRRAVIAKRIADAGQDDGQVFQVGVEAFLDARKRCRFELCELMLSNHAYEQAIYNCHLLQTEEPESHYLKKVIAEALYGLSSYKNARRFSDAHWDADDVEGEFQQLAYFMEMSDRICLNVVALHETWEAYLAAPEDAELKSVAQEMLVQLFEKHRSTTEWLAHEQPATMPPLIDSLLQAKQLVLQARVPVPKEVVKGEDADEEESEEAAEEDEEEEEEAEEEEDTRQDPNAFLEWALTDLFQNETFAEAWAAQAAEAAAIKDEVYISATKQHALSRKERLQGVHLGIDKIVLVQPIYKSVDMRDEISVQYLASETALETYKETLAQMAKRNDLQYEFLENRNLEIGDVQAFNDVSTMLLWFSDHLNGDDEKVQLVNFKQEEAQALIDRFGTKYFAWNAEIQVTERRSQISRRMWLVMGCAFFPVLPLAIYKNLKPQKRTLFVTMVFDLEKSEAIWESYHVLKANASPAASQATIYDKFLQIKRK